MNPKNVLKIASRALKHPRSLRAILHDETAYRDHVRKRYGLKQGLPVVDVLDLVPSIDLEIEPYSFLGDTSTPLDIALLCQLAAGIPDCEYLEIGSHRGESLVNVGRHAARCTAISLGKEDMRAMGYSEPYVRSQNVFLPREHGFALIAHNSQTLDYTPYEGRFDLIFIDGDHSCGGVRIDTANCFRLLKGPESVIVWHDYTLNTDRVRWEVLAGILDGAPPEAREHIYQVSNTMCAIYKRGVSTAFERTADLQVPNKRFRLRIKTEPMQNP
jgi:predicted O-methyltransferase YrrM